MNFRKSLAGSLAAAGLGLSLIAAPSALGATTATTEPGTIASAVVSAQDLPNVTGNAITTAPPNGTPIGISNSDLALFPLNGPNYGVFSTGDVNSVELPNSSDSTSTDNGGDGGGHGTVANDLVTLRIDLNVPQDKNCLTVDYRFLTEEFPEFVGSQFNDAFLIEVDATDFTVDDGGKVTAPSNIAFGPDGNVTTVNAAGTSSDNALGTTYDGATPIQRATTPITAGAHSVYITIYDASDRVFDSTAFVDNLKLRTADPSNCKRGAAPGGAENGSCQGEAPTVIVSGGVASGTKGDDVILGSDGDDKIRGRGGDDIICGGDGDDEIRGNAGEDDIVGNSGDDVIFGNGGDDEIRGLRDEDEIHGQSGDDEIRGGTNDDTLFGGNGDDRMSGNQGDDVVRGRVGDDNIQGNKDKDKLGGGKGTDECRGGTGKDTKTGCESRP